MQEFTGVRSIDALFAEVDEFFIDPARGAAFKLRDDDEGSE